MIGLKSLWLQNHMQLNMSMYTIDWSDAQSEINLPDCGNVYIVNAGAARSDGLEFEWVCRVSDAWDLRFVSAWNDSRITNAALCTGIDYGTSLPLVPDWTAAASSTSRFPLTGKYVGFLRADWQYTGKTQTSQFAEFKMEQASYYLVNLKLGIDGGAWTVTFFADNLFDEQASILCCRFDGGYVTNRPRTVGIKTRIGF